MNCELDDEGPLIDHVKPILIGHWKICFSGDTPPASKYDVDIHRFLGQVDAFRRTARISHRALLSQILHLLAGSARDWFQLESRNIKTWADFERKLKENFLSSTHDTELYAKAFHHKQGKNESVATYINQMQYSMR